MRSRNEVVARERKRPRLQQNIKSMFLQAGPKFVDVGSQPGCSLYMNERAGDLPIMEQKQQNEAKRPVQRNPVQFAAIPSNPKKLSSHTSLLL